MTAETTHTFPLLRNLAILAAAWSVVLAAAVAVLYGLGLTEQLAAMLAAAGACGIAAAVAMIPMGLMGAARREGAINGAMIGLMVRLFGSLGGAALIGWATAGVKPVLAWTIGWYLFLLTIEVVLVSSYLSAGGDADASPTEGATC